MLKFYIVICFIQIIAKFAKGVVLNKEYLDEFNKTTRLLDLKNKGIDSIEKEAFENFKILNVLELQHNNITNLKPHVFLKHSLEYLNLSFNSIQKIDHDEVFFGLNSLKVLDLSNNDLVQMRSYALHHLGKLTHLSLNNNHLHHISSYWFRGLHNLKYLNLKKNLISMWSCDVFNSLEKLEKLDLSENYIFKIIIGVLKPLKSLFDLNLSVNLISYIKNDTFCGLTNLKTVNLDKNNLTNFKSEDYACGNKKIKFIVETTKKLRYGKRGSKLNNAGFGKTRKRL